jgi:Na+-translocating ferredoxin:NAD+ oxidoreductase subunit B
VSATSNRPDSYARLARALDGLANGFPRTESGVELEILRRAFSPEQASVASLLTGRFETTADISRRADIDEGCLASILRELALHNLVWTRPEPEEVAYRLAPFMPVGIYEAKLLEQPDPEFASLVEQYFREGGAAGMMQPRPAIHRVLPARDAVDAEWVLPYDDVRTILQGAASFRLERCSCRLQQEELGQRRCDFPLDACLWFSYDPAGDVETSVSREQALSVLDEAERIGLVHTVSNVASKVGYVCNCCGCCCALLRGINEWGIEASVAHANYLAEIDVSLCSACGTCEQRCQVAAIVTTTEASAVDRDKCIGCGLCATGCPTGAARLRRKPPHEIVAPPVTMEAWEHLRLATRGLIPGDD